MRGWQAWKSNAVAKLEQVNLDESNGGQGISEKLVVEVQHTFQTMLGFGGAFNELGWSALQALDRAGQEQVLRALFHDKDGCGFTLCRTPIGASDFARDAYSLADTPEDYGMEHFTIGRDKECLIPYIRAAATVTPSLRVWASPWSPPAWMKTTGSMCGGGELIDRHEVLNAYALYLLKYVRSYAAEGIPIMGICPQNETDVVNHYPTATLPEGLMLKLLRAYLIPLFLREKVGTEIWLGTIRALPEYARTVLADSVADQFISGIGYQYSKGSVVGSSSKEWPGKKIIHTESPCHNGANSWVEAMNIGRDILMYVHNGAVNYCYWNMILDETGKSSWDWRQNSMITVDRSSGEVHYNHEYYVMKHYSAFVKPGAVRIAVSGRSAGSCAAFRNPDGSLAVIVMNDTGAPYRAHMNLGDEAFAVTLDQDSIYTFVS